MFVATTWKSRPLSPDQSQRMMETSAKAEAKEAENSASERVCWFISVDGSSGMTVSKVADSDATEIQLMLEVSLALGEYIELNSRIVLDLDTAMPAITERHGLRPGRPRHQFDAVVPFCGGIDVVGPALPPAGRGRVDTSRLRRAVDDERPDR